MSKNLFIACLLLAVVSSELFLTPAFPSTAYQNQFYSVRFRVRGLDSPVFSFEGLPKSLSGSLQGVLSGIPSEAGSFSIMIKYRAGAQSGSKQVILKVLADYRNTQSIVKATQTRVGLVIQFPNNLIFRAGQTIRIPFSAKNSIGALIWSFHGLPTGIKGDSNKGVVEGTVVETGYYNIQVQCGDGQGKSAQAFVTVNIQPKTSLTSTKIVQVQTKPVSNSILATYDKIEAEQVAADNELFKALEIVGNRKKIVTDVKQQYAVATLRVSNAQNSFNAADAAWKQAAADKQIAQSLLSSAKNVLNAAQQNLELALTEQTQSTARLTEARKAAEQAQKRFNYASKAVSDAEDALVEAKKNMAKCEQAMRTAQTQKTAAAQQYKRAFTALEAAKTQLEDAKTRKQRADQAVKAAQDSLQLVQQARDDAQNDLKQADFNLGNAQKILDAALKKVATIREKFNNAEKQYSAAKWDWELVINKLYVVQARKEAADRASAIALAEGSFSDHNVNNGVNNIGGGINIGNGNGNGSGSGITTVNFGGCDAKTYPVISGTSKVVSVNAGGYTLSSGHSVVYGSCSSISKCAAGDYINYNGYIVNGVINAVRIERVLLS